MLSEMKSTYVWQSGPYFFYFKIVIFDQKNNNRESPYLAIIFVVINPNNYVLMVSFIKRRKLSLLASMYIPTLEFSSRVKYKRIRSKTQNIHLQRMQEQAREGLGKSWGLLYLLVISQVHSDIYAIVMVPKNKRKTRTTLLQKFNDLHRNRKHNLNYSTEVIHNFLPTHFCI